MFVARPFDSVKRWTPKMSGTAPPLPPAPLEMPATISVAAAIAVIDMVVPTVAATTVETVGV